MKEGIIQRLFSWSSFLIFASFMLSILLFSIKCAYDLIIIPNCIGTSIAIILLIFHIIHKNKYFLLIKKHDYYKYVKFWYISIFINFVAIITTLLFSLLFRIENLGDQFYLLFIALFVIFTLNIIGLTFNEYSNYKINVEKLKKIDFREQTEEKPKEDSDKKEGSEDGGKATAGAFYNE